MANSCISTIKFYSEDTEQLTLMYERFKEIYDSSDTGWMGDYADAFFPEYGHDKMNCRGRVDEIDEIYRRNQYSVFTIWTETAWGPKIGIWYLIVKRFYPSVKIAYIAEEQGNALFARWDETEGHIFYPETLYVDGCLPDKEGECDYIDDHYGFGDLQDVMTFLDKRLPFEYVHANSEDALTKEVQAKLEEYGKQHECDDNLYLYVEPFEEVHPSDYDPLD